VNVFFFARLISYSTGTLVYLFLLALILGHRRPRFFERLLFFLALCIFMFYAGGLLEMNAELQYASPPEATKLLYESLITLGMLFLPGFLLHAHLQYFHLVRPSAVPCWSRAIVFVFYFLPFSNLLLSPIAFHQFRPLKFRMLLYLLRPHDFVALIMAILICAGVEFKLASSSTEPTSRLFFRLLCGISFLMSALIALWQGFATFAPMHTPGIVQAMLIGGMLPGALLIYFALRHNFLEFGAQRNLVYALSATFLALLYLALVRRVSGWLESALPPEATAAILLFVLIFLFEPLERAIGPALYRSFTARIGRLQQLTLELQEEARRGNIANLISDAERRIREEFGLAVVRLTIPHDPEQKPLEAPGGLGHTACLPLLKDGKEIGLLEAASTGSFLTGETSAALEFLAEQLPAMVDLCGLIEDKLRLERELAERERLALLGQMAASVSHNLRNPLSSMKTVLQVQLENPNLPLDVRHDCALVVDEIDRMSAKLTQLLRYAKPSVNGQRISAVAVARQIASLFGRDAERRNIRLEFEQPAEEISVLASEDALSEILSNLILNAIEAQPNGGRVRIALLQKSDRLEIQVDDDGPGISPETRAKIFQPFFTTKATGTGLGLTIVARRITEIGGTLACESPLEGGRGTRFHFTLPLAGTEE
jgi:signal transduction histidine kinase